MTGRASIAWRHNKRRHLREPGSLANRGMSDVLRKWKREGLKTEIDPESEAAEGVI